MHSHLLYMNDDLSLRPARESDRSFIESLYHSTHAELHLFDAAQDFIELLIEQQRKVQIHGYGFQFPDAIYFVIEKQLDRIGRVVLDFTQDEIRVIDIALIPEARGKGYITSIMRALEHTAGSVHAPMALSVTKPTMLQKNSLNNKGSR
jgi:RimJ/RimL family protein N-acetyltransferase